jgi:hypothetical protein
VLLKVIGALVVVVIAILLFLPTMRTGRGAARRIQCGNNLKQIGFSLHNYHDHYGSLPPAYTVDANGNRLHSWRTLILPFGEQKALYESIDLTKPWDDPANREAYESVLDYYHCHSAEVTEGHTPNLAIVSPGSCFQATESRKLEELTDGTDHTLMVVEVDAEQAVHWMQPTDIDPQWLVNLAQHEERSHVGGVQALFADGRVKFLQAQTDPDVLRAMVSIAGGETFELPE